MIIITEYKPEFQKGIDLMMQGIEKEFPIPITSPQSTRIHEAYHLPDQKFWVALHNDQLVGTIGLSLFKENFVFLKRMMVDKNYRGKSFGTATLLLNESVSWAKIKGFNKIYLGTMDQFHAAQNFYEKSGFRKIEKGKLPASYAPNPIDTLYYTKEI